MPDDASATVVPEVATPDLLTGLLVAAGLDLSLATPAGADGNGAGGNGAGGNGAVGNGAVGGPGDRTAPGWVVRTVWQGASHRPVLDLTRAVGPVFDRVWRSGEAETVGSGPAEGASALPRFVGWAFRTATGVGLFWRDRSTVPDPAQAAALSTAGPAEGATRPDRSGPDQFAPDLVDGDPLEDDPGDDRDAHDPAHRRAIGTWEWDPASGTVDGSVTAGQLLGLEAGSTHAALGDLLGGIWQAHRRRVTATLRAAMDVDAPFTTRFATVADPSRTVRVVGQPITVGGDRRLAGIVEDVTESARDEQALARSQRLASLGMLAAGIAHDFNNLLTVVSMRADMIRTDALDGVPGDAAGDATAILDAADRAAALTRQLMLFAGQQEGESRLVDLAVLADGLRPMVSSLRGSQVEVEFDLAPVPPVMADPVQLEQVLLNLALNARDALAAVPPGAGQAARVTVRVHAETGPVGPAVVLEVADNGPGMDAETLARACDPFFTTKTVGRGTGLGLSVVFGIAERLGGRLDITSQVGAGTTVRVVLPGVRPAGRLLDAEVPDEGAAAPAARVLVVDDEPAMRAAHARVLERAGYRVALAEDGLRALAVLAADPGIVAVVSDVLMPGMDGTELAGLVLRDHAEVRVLLVTGIAPPTDVLVHPRVGLVGKPVSASQLVGELRALLAVPVV